MSSDPTDIGSAFAMLVMLLVMFGTPVIAVTALVLAVLG